MISNSLSDASRHSPPPGHVERPGFPTYAQYKQVEAAYLQSLTPRRQGKALISQALFDRIWDVLHQPEYQGETAQFRFWARKMFTLSKTHRVTLGGPEYTNTAPQEVLLHDNLLVAIQEQLYDLLCYCHGSTGHGGRDKTCALIRKHYTWVPKDLVSNFIKACPTCIVKKCGNVDSTIASPVIIQQPQDTNAGMRGLCQEFYGAEVPAASSSSNLTIGIPWPSLGSPRDNPLPSVVGDDPLEAEYREAVLRSRGLRSLSSAGGSTPRGLYNFPMSREVSLYKGLPNGWQYRHHDYATAHAEFMKMKDLPLEDDISLEAITAPRSHRPRVPSILPLWGPDHFPHPDFQNMQETDLGDSEHLPSLDQHTSGQIEFQNHSHSSNVSLQYLLMASHQAEDKAQDYMHQIDPILLEMANASASGMNEHIPEGNADNATLASSNSFPSSTSLKRAAAPLHINLEFANDKTFQAFLAYRDSLGEGGITPDSPLMNNWHPGNPSPASSDSSSSSQLQLLSPFPTSASTTPGSSTLTTPVDECGSQGGSKIIDIKGKRRQDLLEAGAAQELSENIQAACGL